MEPRGLAGARTCEPLERRLAGMHNTGKLYIPTTRGMGWPLRRYTTGMAPSILGESFGVAVLEIIDISDDRYEINFGTHIFVASRKELHALVGYVDPHPTVL